MNSVARLEYRYRRWRWRRHVSNIEDTIACLRGESRLPVVLVSFVVSLRHPGSIPAQIEGLEAERRYYQNRLRALERDWRGDGGGDPVEVTG